MMEKQDNYIHLSKFVNKVEPRTIKDYLYLNLECKKAVDELKPYENKIISASVYGAWIEKYKYLSKQPFSIEAFLTYDFGFDSLYTMYEELYDYYKCNSRASNAVKDWLKIDHEKEEVAWLWLRKNIKLYHQLLLFDFKAIDYKNPKNNEYFVHSNQKINTRELLPCIAFRKIIYQYF